MSDTPALSRIEVLAGQIRDIVNCCEVHYRATQKFSTFAKLCTCMDTISDAQYAIAAFDVDSRRDNFGLNYLMVYGLFQAFVIQQDAVFNLCAGLHEAIGTGFSYTIGSYPDLEEVRELRNDIVGHPTLRRSETKGTASYHSISRFEMMSSGIRVLSEYMHGSRREFRWVSIAETVQKQADDIVIVLESILRELQAWQEADKAEHSGVKLSSYFAVDFEKLFNQVHACIKGERPQIAGVNNIATLSQTMHDFDAELHRRGLSVKAYPGIEDTYQELQHPMAVLREFFQLDAGQIDVTAIGHARLMAFFVQDRFADLRDMACETDTYYENAPEENTTDGSKEGIPALHDVLQKINELIERSEDEEDTSVQIPPERTLADRFRDLSYELAKTHDGTDTDSDRIYPTLCFGQAQDTLTAIIDELRQCIQPAEQGKLSTLADETTFPLKMLSEYFYGAGTVSSADADIYAWYLGEVTRKLRDYAVREGLIIEGIEGIWGNLKGDAEGGNE